MKNAVVSICLGEDVVSHTVLYGWRLELSGTPFASGQLWMGFGRNCQMQEIHAAHCLATLSLYEVTTAIDVLMRPVASSKTLSIG